MSIATMSVQNQVIESLNSGGCLSMSQGSASTSAPPGRGQYPWQQTVAGDTATPTRVGEPALLSSISSSREASAVDCFDQVELSSSACLPTNGAEAEAEPSVNPMYSLEIIRLGSFQNWPSSSADINPRKFAKAGLFYTGQGDTLQCYQCSRTFSGWLDGDIPIQRHHQESQDCLFARELFMKDNEAQRSQNNTSSQHRGFDVSDNATSNIGAQQSSSNGHDAPDSSCLQSMQRLSIHNVNTSSSTANPASSNTASDYYAYDTAATARNVKHCGEHCPKDLNTELHRIHTFYGWPESTPVRPEHLAKLGFFYLGVRDKVECAFCGGVLHQWEEGDDPKREHERHYPHCPFIRNCATSNVPLDSPDGDSSDGQSERRGHTESEPPPPPGGTDCPKHPELSSEEDRLSTFFRWPLYSPISPRKLAQAGFYYTYIDDQVKCYWCEGGLKDWQAGDDPWTEHARWYGEECGFVLRERGIGYVRQIKNTFPSLVQVAHHHSQQDFVQDFIVGSANVTVQVGNLDPEDEFEERVLDAMDSRVVRNVVEMGFGQQNVETVVRRRLRARRGPFTTMTDLVESLLAMDEHPDGQGQDPDAEDEEDRNVEGPTPTGNQEPAAEEAAAEQMEEEPEEETPASMEELQQRLRRMKEERMCKICMSNDATMVFIPCGHLCCCEGCAHSMRSRGRKCPICRARILKVQRAFLA